MTIREQLRSWLLEHPKFNPYKLSANNALLPLRQMTRKMRALPDFIIIGASRSGTTSLYYNMSKHPNISPGAEKASSFFDKNFERGLSFYKSHFPVKPSSNLNKDGKFTFVTGEATTTYLLNPLTAERISDTIPNVKLIAILRNPIDRAFSHFNYHLTRGESKFQSFEEAINYEKKLIKLGNFKKNIFENKEIDYRFCSYLSEGLYVERLEPYLENFSKDQIMIIKYEDYITHEKNVLNKIFNFLNLPVYDISNLSKLNSVNYENINEDTKRNLQDFFKPYNEKLIEKFGPDIRWD